jgi:predicted SAM-dependent methyltransferase
MVDSFFELNPKQQADRILHLVMQQKQSRKVLDVPDNGNVVYFQDLKWKLKEIEENKNPIPIPQNTPWRLLKRIIGKLIRFYTRKQVHFNMSMTSFAELVSIHLESIQKQIQSLEINSKDNQSFGASILSEMDQLKKKIYELEDKSITESNNAEKINDILNKLHELRMESYVNRSVLQELKEIVEGYGSSFDKASTDEQIKALHSRLSHLHEWLSGLDNLHHNLYKWVELIGKRTDQLENYQDRVRKELFAELNYSTVTPRKNSPVQTQKIVNSEKITESLKKNVIKLNLGCGTDIKDDYINIDSRTLPGVDIICDVRSVPFTKGSVDTLYLSHVIEHFPEIEMSKVIMPYWYELLKPGGKIVIICPDWEAMLKGYAQGEISYEALKEVTFGSQEYEGNFHFNQFTSETLTRLLEDVGFKQVRVVEKKRRNGLCYEMEVEGVK